MDTNHAALLAEIKHELLKQVARIDAALGELPLTRFEIVKVERGQTKHADPMLKLFTRDGTLINAFMSQTRDDFKLFQDAEYGERFHSMSLFDSENWTQHPIVVECRKPGQWWELVKVHPREVGAGPDVPVVTKHEPTTEETNLLAKLKFFNSDEE